MLHSPLFDTPTTYTWLFTPSIVIGLISLVVLYVYFISLDRRDGHWGQDIRGRHVAFFFAGILVLYLALQSPLDDISDTTLFSAHMTQHILLGLIGPVLLASSIPTRWLRTLLRIPIVGQLLSFFTKPIVALLLFNIDLWVWHLPAFYEGALRDTNVHVLQHLLIIATGTLFWLTILHDITPARSLSYLTKIALLFFSMVSSGILGAIFCFAGNTIYTFYGNAPLSFGLTPLDDQQLAGAIMWVPGGGIFFVALLLTFAAWLKNEDRKGAKFDQQQKEATQ
jgi:cytochrome c oxidase assembly factor CtaG